MKKLLAMLVTAVAVLFVSSSLSSCSKADTLVGTTWTATYLDETHTLTFISESSFTMLSQDGRYSYTYTGTYTRSGSSITLIADGFAITGTINGNTLTLIANGDTIVFFKR